MIHIDELTPGLHRLSHFRPEFGITFNQFLIDDDEPTLIHTGTFPMYEDVRKAVAQVLDPARLRYIVIPHFEADECGGMGRFAAGAKSAELICGEMGAALNLLHWDFAGPVRGMRDGATLELGTHRLRFWETPHVHHWDSMMVVEETTRALFPADLFIQPGEQPAVVRENLGAEMCDLYTAAGIFAGREPVLDVALRVESADLEWIHPMHGGSLPREAIAHYTGALRERPFTYDGRLLGRSLRNDYPPAVS